MITKTSGNGFALYNGVRLPELPELPYEYVTITETISDIAGGLHAYILRCYTKPVEFSSEDDAYIRESCDQAFAIYQVSPTKSEDWGDFTYITVDTSIVDAPVWSDYDIADSVDGTVKFAASDPIPLDGMEAIEWDGDTTGLEVEDAFCAVSSFFEIPSYGFAVVIVDEERMLLDNVGYFVNPPSWGVANGEGVTGVIAASSDSPLGVPSGLYFLREGPSIYTTLFAYPSTTPPEPDPEITSVKVYPAEVTMRPGTDRTFEAVVTGTGTFDSSVDWTVQYGEEYGTPTITQDGQLTIPADMRPCKVIVIARSVENPDYGGIAIVNVVRDTVYDDVSGPAGGNGSYGAGEEKANTALGIDSISNTAPLTTTGMNTLYALNSKALESFGSWLWSTDILENVGKAVINILYNSPIDSIINLTAYPFSIADFETGVSHINNTTFPTIKIHWGFTNTGVNGLEVSRSSGIIDWGTVRIDEYWGSFLDYSPYTSFELFLPWGSGFIALNPAEILNKEISIKSVVDVATGSCVHHVIINNEVYASYSAQPGITIPVTSSDFASKLARFTAAITPTLLGSGIHAATMCTAMTSTLHYGNAAHGPVSGMLPSGATSSAGAISTAQGVVPYNPNAVGPAGIAGDIPGFGGPAKSGSISVNDVSSDTFINPYFTAPSVPAAMAAIRTPAGVYRNGNFSNGDSSIGVNYPYIFISRPDLSIPENYGGYYGYPSNIFSPLKDITGYTEISEIHLNDINATEVEVSMLHDLLKGGVLF